MIFNKVLDSLLLGRSFFRMIFNKVLDSLLLGRGFRGCGGWIPEHLHRKCLPSTNTIAIALYHTTLVRAVLVVVAALQREFAATQHLHGELLPPADGAPPVALNPVGARVGAELLVIAAPQCDFSVASIHDGELLIITNTTAVALDRFALVRAVLVVVAALQRDHHALGQLLRNDRLGLVSQAAP